MVQVMVLLEEEVVARVEEVFLADEAIVVQDVQLFPGRQLLPTDQAGEAVDVEDTRSWSSTHQVRRQDPLLAPGALCPEFPDIC